MVLLLFYYYYYSFTLFTVLATGEELKAFVALTVYHKLVLTVFIHNIPKYING